MMNSIDLAAIDRSDMTLAKLLKNNAARYGSKKTALRVKALGIWQETSWQEYYEKVVEFSLGLSALGIRKGETVAIIGHNRPSSLYAIIGAQVAGGVPLCIHHESTSAEVAEYIVSFNIKYLFAEDQEQVDKTLENPATADLLKKIIYCNQRGMSEYSDKQLVSLDDALSSGKELHLREPMFFDKMLSAGSAKDNSLICITSGSSGKPRGTVFSQRNILSTAISLTAGAGMREGQEVVSFLPLSLIGELMISLASAILVGFRVNFPEKPETVMEDLREIGPHLIFAPPEIWGGIASSVQIRIMETTPFKRFMYRTFITMGEAVADQTLSGKAASFASKMMYGIAYTLLIRAVRDRLGLSRIQSAITSGSPLGKDVFRFFHSIGVNLKQVYGLAEMSGAATMHLDNNIRVESVGVPLKGVEVSISTEGEILLKGAGLASSYYGNEGKETGISKAGWLHTGDAGRIDTDGHLIVTDRCDSIITLANGNRVAPQLIESSIRFSPYIKEVIVTGRGESFLSALICISGKVVGKWAGDNKLGYNSYSDLASKAEVYTLIGKELQRVNSELPPDSRIKRFTIIYKDLDPDDGEITRNGKVRRAVVESRFNDVIKGLYSGSDSMNIDKTIELGDNKSARVQSTILFKNLD
ncbi:MAG: AMP-binding protein [Geobacteraceae bacterium]|nr:AMP-binding protein [Geobacteraceae bacterium]